MEFHLTNLFFTKNLIVSLNPEETIFDVSKRKEKLKKKLMSGFNQKYHLCFSKKKYDIFIYMLERLCT